MKKLTTYCVIAIIVLSAFLLRTAPTAFAAQPHPAGTLVSINSAVWLIDDNGTSRHAIDSAEKFYSHRFSFSRVVPANAADLSLVDAGLLPWGDGVLFSDHAIIYQVSDGTKHGFIAKEVFLGQGFSFEKVIPGNLSSLAEGTPVRSAGDRHLDGTLLTNSNGAIFVQSNAGVLPFPSAAVFLSYGGSFNEAVPINNNDGSASSVPIGYQTGTLVNDNGAVWLTQPGSKRGFPTAQCLLDFGFSFGMVIPGSTSSLPAQGTICADPTSSPTPGATSSYSSQNISTSDGTFGVRVSTFNLASGKVRVTTDTAADRDCTNNCPVVPLNTYASVNHAQSGMNGTYFCPTDYPTCAGQTNSFFWKVIDTGAGKAINATNGLGELDPMIVFDSIGSARYFHTWNEYKASNFSAVAGINSASIMENGQISLVYSKLDNKQQTVRSTQGILGLKGQTLYLIHVMGATIPETAQVLKAMGLDYAIILDGGGSAAMMYQGQYKTGPGRNMPNVVLVTELP